MSTTEARKGLRRPILLAVGALAAILAVALVVTRDSSTSSEEREATRLVERFGSRLQSVGLQDPRPTEEIRAAFSQMVTPQLLASWLDDPSRVPARHGSSPWPERIEVQTVRQVGTDTYEVKGDVIWVTSAELVEGGGHHEPIALTVRRETNLEWRISALRGGRAD